MKTLEILLIIGFASLTNLVKSQDGILPDVNVYNLDGKSISASQIGSTDETVVIYFWKYNNGKSLDQLLMLNEKYEDQSTVKNLRIVGICTDAAGAAENIKPLVYGNNISFEIYVDRNNDLKRAMNVPEVPFTAIYEKGSNNSTLYTGYCPNILDMINDKIDPGFTVVATKL
jgi:hypothetical protein